MTFPRELSTLGRDMKDRSRKRVENMHALAKFGLATVLVMLAVLSNVLVTLSALSGANAQIQGPQPEATVDRRGSDSDER